MKNKNILPLSLVPEKCRAVIAKMPSGKLFTDRLLRYGITENIAITKCFSAPSGDPCAYLFRGTLITLRNRDAEEIQVEMR